MTTTLDPTTVPERSPAAPEAPARPDATSRDANRARRGGLQAFLRGREHDPAWVRPCLLALLVGTAVLYLWGLGASGWANTYYSAAVQAATVAAVSKAVASAPPDHPAVLAVKAALAAADEPPTGA